MQQRARVEYVIEPQEKHWSIFFSGVHCGHYPSREVAIEVAVGDARRVREHGSEALVRVRDADGSVSTLSIPEAA